MTPENHVPMFSTYQRLDLRVTASPRQVIRAARRVIAVHHRNARAARDARREFYGWMLEHHKRARTLFNHYRF